MTRLYIVVEGQTEETFVKDVLGPALYRYDVFPAACLIGKPGHKGGVLDYARAEGDITRLLKQDRRAYCTTMLDYFRLPVTFPGMPPPHQSTTAQKAETVECALHADIVGKLDQGIRPDRFIPYIQMHEFEGLLFSDPSGFARGLYSDGLAPALARIRSEFATPEDIDDGPTTAPSKRIMGIFDGYQKPLHGSLAAIGIGLDVMRRECPHFNAWVRKLEALGHT